jgi:DNA-binding NtrC family response regulator
LRVVEQREIKRLGSDDRIPVDVRIVAATDQSIESTPETFRPQLLIRLSVFPIIVPPLRDRHNDIPILAKYFFEKHCLRHGRQLEGIDESAMKRLCEYHWPFNIRELSHMIERAVIRIQSGLILPEHLTGFLAAGSSGTLPSGSLFELTNEFQRKMIREAWKIAGTGVAATARQLKIDSNTLKDRMKSLGIWEELRS